MNLSKEEAAFLSEKVRPHSWGDLAAQWANLTYSLDGYDHSIYDYDNDVSVRLILQQAVEDASRDLQAKVARLLQEHDERFLNKTKSISRPRYEGDIWHSRIPVNPGPSLQEDIDQGNL
jgi:hypothetical protein